MKKEILIFGIIFLFIGVGIQPAFAIDISKTQTSNSNDLVEITLQLCKTYGVEDHKMFITQEQNEQLDRLIESFKVDLENSDSYEETVRIYNDMVVSLDELGILPESTNCKDVQELVTGENTISNPVKMKTIKHFEQAYEKLKNKNLGLDENENMFCLIAGDTTNTFTVGLGTIGCGINIISLWIRFGLLYSFFEIIYASFLSKLLQSLFELRVKFWLFTIIFSYLFPLKLGGFLTYGTAEHIPWTEYYPSNGWVFTNGLNGKKTWDGPFYGDISKLDLLYTSYYLGAIGFTGIKINPAGSGFYLGSAFRVKLSSNPSDNLNAGFENNYKSNYKIQDVLIGGGYNAI